jgi:hypothetical protein
MVAGDDDMDLPSARDRTVTRVCPTRGRCGFIPDAPRSSRSADRCVDVRIDGWDIRGRWFGVMVGATPRLGELPRGQKVPWRVIAAQIAPRERHG